MKTREAWAIGMWVALTAAGVYLLCAMGQALESLDL